MKLRNSLALTIGIWSSALCGCPSITEPAPPQSLGVVVNKFCNGYPFHTRDDATGDTIELLVTQKALDARGLLLKDFSPRSRYEDFDNGGGFIFQETEPLWRNVRGGTLIVLTWTNNVAVKRGDTVITAGLLNTSLFRPARGGNTNFFNIAQA